MHVTLRPTPGSPSRGVTTQTDDLYIDAVDFRECRLHHDDTELTPALREFVEDALLGAHVARKQNGV